MRTLFRLFQLSNPFKSRFQDSERGQVVIVLAAAFLIVMLGSSALAVDVGNGLLQKRRLQNVADAASMAGASVLARGGQVPDAVAAAQSIVTSNTNGIVSLPYPGTGTGVNLQNGIEISGSDVRVALQRPVDTMFGGAVGLNTMNVVARSRANTRSSSSFLPIAVKRFSDGNTAYDLDENGNPSTVVDYLARGDTATIDEWPDPLTSPAPTSPGDSATYDPTITGQVAPILGSKAEANVSQSANFHFWIAPDLRDLTSSPPTYINPPVSPSTSAQQWKDIESSYFYPHRGYTGPLPTIGQQIATMNGVVTNMAVAAMRRSFKPGDVVAVMVYNGTVYGDQDFSLSVTPAIQNASGPNEVTYSVKVTSNNNFSSGGIKFSVVGVQNQVGPPNVPGWGDWRFDSQSSYNSLYTKSVSTGGATLDLYLKPSGSLSGIKTALVVAHDPGTNITRTALVSMSGSGQGYSVTSVQPYQAVEQNSSANFNLTLRGQSGYNENNLGIVVVDWYRFDPNTGTPLTSVSQNVNVSLKGGTVKVQNNKNVNATLTFDVLSSAPVSSGWGDYIARVTLTDPAKGGPVWLHLKIIPAGSQTNVVNTTTYVNALGYAYFVITYANGGITAADYSPSEDGGTMYGYAVTGLLDSPEDAPQYMGMNARLVPWD